MIKNGYVGIKELGVIACTNAALNQLICDDSDEDLWANLLRWRWPSTTLLSQEVVGAVNCREWCKRFLTCSWRYDYERSRSELPCMIDNTLRERLEGFRQQLLSMGYIVSDFDDHGCDVINNRPALPPISEPSLAPKDVMFLVDTFHGSEHAHSTAFEYGDFDLCTLPVANFIVRPFELEISNNGTFSVQQFFEFKITIHAVRLTDHKIICLYGPDAGDELCSGNGYCFELIETSDYDRLQKIEMTLERQGHLVGGNVVSPNLSRIGCDDDDAHCSKATSEYWEGFRFHMTLSILLPRSPRQFGYEYTLAQFRRNHNTSDFSKFSRNLWTDAASNPDLTIFFRQAKEAKASNKGKCWGEISIDHVPRDRWNGGDCPGLRYTIMDNFMYEDEGEGWYLENSVSLLHILADLFDHEQNE